MKKLLAISIAMMALATWSAYADDDVKAKFGEKCVKCHGEDGKGQTKMGQKVGCKDFTDPKVQEGFDDAAATKAIKEGFKDPDGKLLMKPQEGLTDDDIKALIAYIRSFKK